VSNPVPPPGSVPPPAAQPGQPVPPPSDQSAPGHQPPADGQQFFELPAETKKKSAKARILSILGTVVVIVLVLGVKFGLRSFFDKDEAKEAKVGDCVTAQGDVPTQDGKETETEAALIDCSSPKATFTVIGRVEGETSTSSKSCDKYFTDEKGSYFVYAASGGLGSGYLLCLQQKKA